MDSPNLRFLLLVLMFASTINAQFPAPHCGSTGNFTADGTYQTTLTTVLSSIYTTNSSSLYYGFFNASSTVSGTSQTLYLFGLCRGDYTTLSCRACLDALASDMRRLCPLQKEALLYTGDCIIRYSNALFLGSVATEPTYVASTSDNVPSPDAYDTAMMKLLNSLLAKPAGGGSLRKYASGNESAGLDMIYAVVQCTPDLTQQQCTGCLVKGVETIKECCVKYTGGRFMVPSCVIMYETNHRFFDPVSVQLPPPPPLQGGDVLPPPPGSISKSLRIVVVVASSAILLVIVIVSVFCFIRKRRRKVSSENVARWSTMVPEGATTSTPARPANSTDANGGEMSTPSIHDSFPPSTNEAQDGSTQTVSWPINDM